MKMQAPGSELSRIKTATKLDQGWDHLDVGLCDSSGHSAGPNCLHIGLLITPAEQMHPGQLLVPLHQDQIHVCESVEAHRTLPARASEQSVLSSNVGFSLKEQSRRSWERFWEPSAYLTKCANSGSKDAFCRAMSSPCVILRPALLCCSVLLTTPDTQLTEWHTCLLCGRHTLGPGRCQGDEGRWGSLSLPSGWQWRVNTWTTKWDDFVRYFWGQSYHIPKYTSRPFSSLENCHRYHFILANTISQLISLSLLPPSSPSTTAGLGKSFWKHKSIVDIPLLQSSP